MYEVAAKKAKRIASADTHILHENCYTSGTIKDFDV